MTIARHKRCTRHNQTLCRQLASQDSPAGLGCSPSDSSSTASSTAPAVPLVGLRKTALQSRNSTCRSHRAIRRMAALSASVACKTRRRQLGVGGMHRQRQDVKRRGLTVFHSSTRGSSPNTSLTCTARPCQTCADTPTW